MVTNLMKSILSPSFFICHRKSVHPLYLQLLDLIFRFIEIYKDRHCKHFSSGIKYSKSIFHIRTSGLMIDDKGTWSIRLEERFQYLTGLIAAGIVGCRKNRNFKIIREPRGKFFRIASAKIFG